MNLDDLSAMATLDSQDMIGQIDNLPTQLEGAWQLGQTQPLPDLTGLKTIVVSGMGGSAIGADLLAACVAAQCTLPIIVHRGYDLPAFARGPETLVVASSHSGNTEETLSSFEKAVSSGCRVMTVSTGGKLAEKAQAAGIPSWRFVHAGQPRAAVGFSFGLLLALVYRLGLIPDPQPHLQKTVQAMKKQQEELRVGISAARNPAKQLAGQLHGRVPIILAADLLEPVARRWKGQVSEIAKSWGQFEFIPEADHNTLAGVVNPHQVIGQDLIVLFLRAASNHPRNQRRIELTRKGFIQAGFTTDLIDAHGDIPMAHMWTALHLGDYTTYYLAMTYQVDPTPVDALESFKAEMKK
jgi:glucose/mannose-6-phosphate isomerase